MSSTLSRLSGFAWEGGEEEEMERGGRNVRLRVGQWEMREEVERRGKREVKRRWRERGGREEGGKEEEEKERRERGGREGGKEEEEKERSRKEEEEKESRRKEGKLGGGGKEEIHISYLLIQHGWLAN